MFCLFLLAAAPTIPPVDEARRVIEWQLRAPPRVADATGLSPDEAQAVRQLYLQSIGQRPPRPTTDPQVPGR